MEMAMNLDGITRLVGYRRVSTGEQVSEGFSLEGQMSDILTWAERNNIEIVKWYSDEGVSGKSFKRPQFDLMVSDLCTDNVLADGAVFYTTSRMGRRISVTATAKDELKRHGKVVISISENLISNDPSSDFVFNMLGCANELQSMQISDDVKNRLTDTASNGYYTGGSFPIGYMTIEVKDQNNKTRKKLVVNEDERSIAEKIFDLSLHGKYGQGLGVLAIASKLNKEGTLNRGTKWNRNKIDYTLNDTTYIGENRFRKGRPDEIIIKVPPIISRKMFEEVQKGLKSRQPKNTESKGIRSCTLLTGFLKCSVCGLNLTLDYGKNAQYLYYKCTTKRNCGPQSCSCPTIRKDKLEEAVKRVLLEKVFNFEHILQNYSELREITKNLSKSDQGKILRQSKKCNSIKGRLSNLYNQIGDGIIVIDSTLKEHIEALRSELLTTENELSHMQNRLNLKIFKFGKTKAQYFCRQIVEFFKKANDEIIKSLLLAVVKEIKVFDGEVQIKGSKYQLVDLVSKAKKGTPLEVPSFVTVWQ